MIKKNSQVYCADGHRDDGDEATTTQDIPTWKQPERGFSSKNVGVRVIQKTGSLAQPARRLFVMVWILAVFFPWFLQVRSYMQLMMPHKISQDLTPASAEDASTRLTDDLAHVCPVRGLQIAGIFWNVHGSHYYASSTESRDVICHFVVPQYNIHGNYHIKSVSEEIWKSFSPKLAWGSEIPKACATSSERFSIDYYFYHGSIGYYSFYEEGQGVFCALDELAVVAVQKLGSYDTNGVFLANDLAAPGGGEYRQSYFYGIFGAIWITYRAFVLRRSFVLCSRHAQRLTDLRESVTLRHTSVFIYESARLTAHGARNFHRIALLYLLVEGLMGDLFLLIAKDGPLAKVQYISLGYNLSSVLSILFEMIETMRWLGRFTQFAKRLLFSVESSMIGELLCAVAMQAFLTALNKSDLRDSNREAEAISYYVWSLVGHGTIVLGLAGFIFVIRTIIALSIVQYKYGSLRVLTSECCVDTVLDVRIKLIQLSGYIRSSTTGRLMYRADTIKSLGLFKMAIEGDHDEFLVMERVHWTRTPRDDILVIAKLSGSHAEPYSYQIPSIVGTLRVCERPLGGDDIDIESAGVEVNEAVPELQEVDDDQIALLP